MNKAALILTLLAGCQMEGKVSGEALKHDFSCLDSRDGERFVLIGSTTRNPRAGIGTASCVDMDDSTGQTWRICSDSEAWLKCEAIEREDAP
jgi:hypothetical protein